MKYYVDVAYCEYSRWNCFGLFNARTDRKPFEIAIISETGDVYYAMYDSIKYPWRVMDEPSRKRFYPLKKRRIFDRGIVQDIRDFLMHSGVTNNALVFYTYVSRASINELPQPYSSFQPICVFDELNYLADSMTNADFGVDSEFLYHQFPEDRPYHMTEKIAMITSHPNWPKEPDSAALSRAKWVRRALDIIDKIKLKKNEPARQAK